MAEERSQVRILVIEDDEDDFVIVRGLLSGIAGTRYDLEWVRTYEEALPAMEEERHDVYLVDYYLGGDTGLDLLREANRRGFTTPVILLTGHEDYETDIDAMKAGAADYLVKGQITSPLLERAIRYAVSQRATEEKLRQAQKMEAIGTLAGGIAHDFNNILAGIIGFTEMVLEDTPEGTPSRRRLELVMKSAFRGRDLVRQILAFSRKKAFRREPVSPSRIVTETVTLLRASIPATVEIAVDITAKEDTIFASASEVQQVIMNLCANAAHAMREKGGLLTISVGEIRGTPSQDLPPGEYVEIAVSDTGTGMEPEVMKRIFEPFFTTKKTGEGTGMGLAVVYGIVKAMEGDITAESTPGAGSVFHIYFPRHEGGPSLEEGADTAMPGGTERVLFVDDEEVLAELGKSMLEKLGYEVTVSTDSRKALGLVACEPSQFDVVVTDQTMPGLTGMALAEEVRKIRPQLPVVLCTGHSDAVSPESLASAGIEAFLMKPLTRAEMARAVREALDGPRNRNREGMSRNEGGEG